MTQEQRALVRYWIIGLSTIFVLVLLYSLLDEPVQFRWFLLPVIFFAAFVERRLRPVRPVDAPTPLEIVQSSRAWSLFFAIFALSSVVLAIASISFRGLGAWLSHNPWLLGPLILAPILIPAIQSEINFYRALGND